MIDLERLFRLRVAVGRYGEMDCAKWWNTRGQLGSLGAAALRRGFPRTHWFAQARSVFAVAARRCEEIYGASDAVTLWRLGERVEEEFESRWETWTANAGSWNGFFESIAPVPATGLKEFLAKLGLVGEDQFESLRRLRKSVEDKTAKVAAGYKGTDSEVQLLALAFDLGRPSELFVPYAVIAS